MIECNLRLARFSRIFSLSRLHMSNTEHYFNKVMLRILELTMKLEFIMIKNFCKNIHKIKVYSQDSIFPNKK